MHNSFTLKTVKVFLVLISLFTSGIVVSQPQSKPQPSLNVQKFEGSIKCVHQTSSDTTYYTYHVKDDFVRIDEMNSRDEIENSLIFDLKSKSITAISPKRKLYKKLPIRSDNDDNNENFTIIKSPSNYKQIHGYKCYQWRVKNKAENTEIAYWVAYDNFEFFEDLLKIWNRSEKSSIFYMKIPDKNGFFPMLQVERTLLRDFRNKQEVIEINKAEIKKDVFNIPKDFISFDA